MAVVVVEAVVAVAEVSEIYAQVIIKHRIDPSTFKKIR